MEATAIALGNVNDISGAIQGLRQRLNKSRSLLNLTEVRVEDAQPRKVLYIHVRTESRKAFENG